MHTIREFIDDNRDRARESQLNSVYHSDRAEHERGTYQSLSRRLPKPRNKKYQRIGAQDQTDPAKTRHRESAQERDERRNPPKANRQYK